MTIHWPQRGDIELVCERQRLLNRTFTRELEQLAQGLRFFLSNWDSLAGVMPPQKVAEADMKLVVDNGSELPGYLQLWRASLWSLYRFRK